MKPQKQEKKQHKFAAKYNELLIAMLVDLLERGKGRVEACKVVDISYQTFLTWLSDPEKPEFLEAIKIAESKKWEYIKETCEKSVLTAATSGQTWLAAAWILERRYSELYGKRLDTTITDKRKTVDELFPPEEELDDAETED